MNIDERIDSIVHVATRAETVKSAAMLVVQGAARMIFDMKESAIDFDGDFARMSQAFDARAEEIAEAIAKNTVADETPDGPTEIGEHRQPEPEGNTTARPVGDELPNGEPDKQPAFDPLEHGI